jgi:hypothetical protein
MLLQPGDRIVDERSEWKVIGKPYSTSGGKIVNVRMESMNRPGVTTVQVWGAHERVRVKREAKADMSPEEASDDATRTAD